MDPDETKYDTDGDGVPDAKELPIGTKATASPVMAMASTTARNAGGTDPLARDSDSDGLNDGAGDQPVSSSPIMARPPASTATRASPDSDGDGLATRPNWRWASARGQSTQPAQLRPPSTSDANSIIKAGRAGDYSVVLNNSLQPGAYGRSGQIYANG